MENSTAKFQIKTVKDYYEEMYQQFPDLNKKDIQRILNYGFKSLYLHNSYGGDTLITDNSFWCYIGTLRRNSLKHFKYYISKLCVKLRILYKRKKINWDGYYYFALTDRQYEEYLSQQKGRGRKRKHFSYGNQILYKILDECKIQCFNRKYIFRIPFVSDNGFSFYIQDFKSDRAELIITRDVQKFKDILVTNNEYEFL